MENDKIKEKEYSDAIDIKAEEYKKYIRNHINNVKKAFEEYGEIVAEAVGCNYEILSKNIEVHDESKYSDEEFNGYRQYFYPTEFEVVSKPGETGRFGDQDAMNLAFKHHVTVNAHHPEFWIVISPSGELEPQRMTKTAIAEMLLDWKAMEYNPGAKGFKWYYENKAFEDHMFHPDTKELIDMVAPKLF